MSIHYRTTLLRTSIPNTKNKLYVVSYSCGRKRVRFQHKLNHHTTSNPRNGMSPQEWIIKYSFLWNRMISKFVYLNKNVKWLKLKICPNRAGLIRSRISCIIFGRDSGGIIAALGDRRTRSLAPRSPPIEDPFAAGHPSAANQFSIFNLTWMKNCWLDPNRNQLIL